MVTRTSEPNRVMLIGLDAGDRLLIEDWCAQGLLPNLAKIQSEGVWASLETTADIVHVSAWPSIFSGTTADVHGLYHAYVMAPGEQAPVRPRPDRCPVPFLWKTLDEQGKRCIVMDAFLTCPVEPFSGIQIVDWGSWTWFSGRTILPASIKKDIAQKFGDYPAENHSMVGMTPPPDPERFKDRLIQGVRKKTAVIEWLATQQEWDLLVAVFGECHAAGHYFWHYQDSNYITYPDACSDALRTAILDVYIELDRAVGTLIDAVGENTSVLVVSGDGMGPNYSGSHILPDLLSRMRAGKPPQSQQSESAGSGLAEPTRQNKSLLGRIRGMVPKEFRAAVSRHLLPRFVNEKLSMHWKTADIDWAATPIFLIENANEGFVRINLQGREPLGIVSTSEYDRICEELLDIARNMTNPDTGKLAASHVHKTRDVFSGPCCAQMPDVIVNWDPEARTTNKLLTEPYGVISSSEPACNVMPYYSGNHRPNAFLAAAGPDFANGQWSDQSSILDIAPTILQHFGITPPAHINGRALNLP